MLGVEIVNIALVKGVDTEYILVYINDPKSTDSQPASRFDYSKQMKIVVNYE